MLVKLYRKRYIAPRIPLAVALTILMAKPREVYVMAKGAALLKMIRDGETQDLGYDFFANKFRNHYRMTFRQSLMWGAIMYSVRKPVMSTFMCFALPSMYIYLVIHAFLRAF